MVLVRSLANGFGDASRGFLALGVVTLAFTRRTVGRAAYGGYRGYGGNRMSAQEQADAKLHFFVEVIPVSVTRMDLKATNVETSFSINPS